MTNASLIHPRYQAGALLGRGAQGSVMRVVDREAPERQLVAKLWNAGSFDPADLAAEFSLLRRVEISGLVRAHDWGRDQVSGAPFLVEDFVPGVTAAEYVNERAAERADRLLHVLTELAATLSALHAAAFLHGDLKPAHVRVTPEHRVFLLDLGSALADRANMGARGFTPEFAAPEVVAGAAATRGADLYSLGAVAWALATGKPPGNEHGRVRVLAPWLPPSLGELLDDLLARHPQDRPTSADQVLQRLGRAQVRSPHFPAAPIGREKELASLAAPGLGVRYVVGPSGAGKSHLLREVTTRALLSGRAARRIAFPQADASLSAKLTAFFRGAELAWPFSERGTPKAPLLLALDDFQAAPSELLGALEAYRCRGRCALFVDVIATARSAAPGAPALELGPLSEPDFARLCEAWGVHNRARITELGELSGRLPGFVEAAEGRAPLSAELVLARTRQLSRPAAELLAILALAGGELSEEELRRFAGADSGRGLGGLAELLESGLLGRRADDETTRFGLRVSEVAPDVASALGSFELSERLASTLLESPAPRVPTLLSVASSAFPPATRGELLERATELARQSGSSAEEIESLLALCGHAPDRTRHRLLRLEKLTRHAGGVHPQALLWLAEAAATDASLQPLVGRRQAEGAARAGDMAKAEELATAAQAAADALGEPEVIALSIATRGALALYRADVARAERLLSDAAARISLLSDTDPEERARLDHNLGVVLLYRDRVKEAAAAFERSLELKRRMGDRGGVRSCLLNLGLALARDGRYDDAQSALREALELARSLGQQAGRAWVLAALSDLELRRRNARAAEAYAAEAEAIRECPPVVMADLCLLRGQTALLDGNAKLAFAALERLDKVLCDSDPSLGAKAKLLEAGAWLAALPAAPRRAARLCIAALRLARRAELPEVEAQARARFLAARGRATPTGTRYADAMLSDAELWALLGALAATGNEPAPLALLRGLREKLGAERAILLDCRADGSVATGFGVDYDGFELSEPERRVDAELVRRALEADAPLYQRELPAGAGQGSRLLLRSAGQNGGRAALLLLEHRFRTGAFDAVSAALCERLAVLVALTARLSAGREAASAPARSSPITGSTLGGATPTGTTSPPGPEHGQTTVLPQVRRHRFDGIIGESRVLSLALGRLDSAVEADLPVLIYGETGTGKELFARALHENGPRSRAPLVAVNCAALPDSLFEAELFGHARGAFTGAERARAGLVARAEGGTLFLDEIGELSLARQASLLRLLESRRYRPVGSDEERGCDVRVVCATNRDLLTEVEQGRFRRDLLFRINVIEIKVPPLRERPEDIPPLVRAFLSKTGASLALSEEAMSALEAHTWPGNVRELEHQIQRLALLGVARVERSQLPRELRRAELQSVPARAIAAREQLTEKQEVERALAQHQGNITHAARELGLTRHGLKKRMLRLGLRSRLGDSGT